MNDLRATLRLQFHQGFTLDDALPLVDYWARLGISHLYASPLFCARPGSMHGYDVLDPTQINPELGGEPALRRLVQALRQRGMGLILDVVSNHMAVGGSGNAWWLDVLEWGRRSPYAGFFDIQWHSHDPLLEGLLLLPYLSSDYGAMLQAGEIPLRLDTARGAFYCEHGDHHFPICPSTYGELLRGTADPTLERLALEFDALASQPDAYARAPALRQALAEVLNELPRLQALQAQLEAYDSRQPAGLQRLHSLLERQSYRLASWRTAADDINWRRFFDVNELGGLRVERPKVFEATHAKLFQLIAQGLVDGLRIDHIDGLADPRGYCRRLRRRVESLLKQRPAEARLRHCPIYVEKILAREEHLARDWSVDGTTGYEFMNQLSLLQHDPQGAAALGQLWSRISGRPDDFMEEARLAREQILNGSLAGDFGAVAQLLLKIARSDLMTRDITLGAIRRALQALVVNFPLYRVYINASGRSPANESFFQQALAGARTMLDQDDAPLLDYLERWLGGEPWRALPHGRQRRLRRQACARFQQLTSPAAAKAVEDTALYRSARLLSRNDVGFDSEHFSAPPEAFHGACLERLQHFPDNLLTTATHDHKRGEDSRARLAVISESTAWFEHCIDDWMRLATPLRQTLADGAAPSPGDEWILYQTLLGSWPLDLDPDDLSALQAYAERLYQWQEKALREAKLRSSWKAPNQAYEQACRAFLDGLLTQPEGRELRRSLAAAAQTLAPAGALNSLSQCLLRMTVPGIPDLYQGNEFWDFSLVDPDNRRPVDFPARRAALACYPSLAQRLERWRNGGIKQYLIQSCLGLRRRWPLLFARGQYLPLTLSGSQATRLLAFARIQGDQRVIVVVPRLAAGLLGDASVPLVPAEHWGDSQVQLPAELCMGRYVSLFAEQGAQPVSPLSGALPVAELLAHFPVSVLCSDSTKEAL